MEEHLVNCGSPRHHPLPTGYLIPTVLDVYYLRLSPRGGEFGQGDEDGYHDSRYHGHLAQGYGRGMGMDHRAYGATGVGASPSSVLTTSPLALRPGRLQSSLARPAGGYGGGGGYSDFPLGRGTGGAAYEGFGGQGGMNHVGCAV